MTLELVIMEYKRYKWVLILKVCDNLVQRVKPIRSVLYLSH